MRVHHFFVSEVCRCRLRLPAIQNSGRQAGKCRIAILWLHLDAVCIDELDAVRIGALDHGELRAQADGHCHSSLSVLKFPTVLLQRHLYMFNGCISR